MERGWGRVETGTRRGKREKEFENERQRQAGQMSTMERKEIIRPVIDNPFLNIVELPGDTVKRDPEPLNAPNTDLHGSSPVLSKDVGLDPHKGTWQRLYIPKDVIINRSSSSPKKKLPLIVYYHGGGFVFNHANSSLYDVFCQGLVEKVGVMVISLEYRLAPENRLPAAYEDAVDGLRSESEERLRNDSILPIYAIDQMYGLCLPEGAGGDHEFRNPGVDGGSKHLEDIKRLGWRVLVTGCSDDPLVDAGKDCAKLLEGKGIPTTASFGDGYHAMEMNLDEDC
nr:probable carboxylesterase 120 [Ipomoea batatas]